MGSTLKELIKGLALAAINSPFGRLIDLPASVRPGRLIDSAFDPGLMTSNGRLPREDGSDWLETLPKRVSGDSRRFIFRSRKTKKIANFEGPFTPRGWLRLT